MIKRRVFAYLAVVAVGSWFVTGCGSDSGDSVPTVPISGTVTLDGKPYEGVSVMFSLTPDWVGAGTTDASGKYELKAEVGANKVVFSKTEGGEEMTPEEEDLAMMDGMGDDATAGESAIKELVPEKYSKGQGLPFTVPEGGTDTADFELES